MTDVNILIAVAGGVVPALFWLWFWLREDERNPEPRSLILASFLAGGVATFLAFSLERSTETMFTGAAVGISWAAIEEVLKFLAACLAAFIHKEFDEPVDAMMYLVTVALGFAAVENSLFLLKALQQDGQGTALLTLNIRFIGATLLHVVSSATVGAALAVEFYKGWGSKIASVLAGLFVATGLHALFNFLIMGGDPANFLSAMLALWSSVIFIFLLFEWVKNKKTHVKK